MREEIEKLTEKAVKNLCKKEVKVNIERPQDSNFGDYATNVAMIVKKNPQEIVNLIKSDILERVEVKNGFINFFISKEYLQKQVGEILKEKDKFGNLKIGKGEKVNVEFISANPTGPLHLGHGRGAFFGDTLANILGKSGFKVIREYYLNDAAGSLQIRNIRTTVETVSKLPPVIQAALSPGSHPYYNEYLNKKISIFKSWDKVLSAIQEENKNFIENKLKIKFDNWFSEEKDLYKKDKVKKIYKWLNKKNLVYEKEGANWLKSSEYGDTKDWVVERSENQGGEYTYLLSDIAYHKDKFDRGFDKLIDIWGADHQGHVGKIKAAIKMLGYNTDDLDILICQVVRLKGGKISKREGNIVTLEWLIDEVGLDATRFFYLMKSLDTQMEFDVELAKNRSAKSPVYYIQYANARICSILRKASGFKPQTLSLNLLTHPSELKLIKELIRLPEIIEDTSKDYQVQRLPQYAMNLATVFHQFYRDCRVISEDKKLTQARLTLVLAVKIVLKNTLDLMGISAPEKM
ncbi:MAG: hypothetical protein A2175_01740 [Candidatus Nealsonbacteria bacterium RBG_13_42_11]|uniref:Arginine--tRNA ligase n=1 Tax=Candidatus Nealsonbacteria bacterium RBG_13_42_11 TaxID=1801663 RepID=A0A1G2DZX9_9BACT|nr:MAG: hypothetical protein A2175_01740 [Candidatus Nealsonbacteria bacterium RBG_13_42_11]